MTRKSRLATPLILLVLGCDSALAETLLSSVISTTAGNSDAVPAVRAVEFQEPGTPELIQPPTVSEPAGKATGTALPCPMPPTGGLTLEALEQMALANNPAVGQASARVRALRGKWFQVGLAPNPSIGYVASEIGDDESAGQQGAFVGQKFITGGKLRRNRAVAIAEITRAEQDLAATEQRVLTDVRQGYYLALLALRRVQLADELARVTSEAVNASRALVEAEEIPVAGLLQTEVQQQNALVRSRTSKNGLAQAWRRLSAVVGGPALSIQPLDGDLSQMPQALHWEEQLVRLQTESPEVAAAVADVERSRRALSRARFEAVPDISTQVTVQYNDSSDYTIAGVQVGIPLPLWNRNQGGIRRAQAEITQSVRNVERIERDLGQRLANAFRQYSDAVTTAETYAKDILPRAQRTFELIQQGYSQGEVGYLDLLAAQQTYTQTNFTYLDALGALWQSYVQIDGLLLTDSLSQLPE